MKEFKLDLKTNFLATKLVLIIKRVLNETSYLCYKKFMLYVSYSFDERGVQKSLHKNELNQDWPKTSIAYRNSWWFNVNFLSRPKKPRGIAYRWNFFETPIFLNFHRCNTNSFILYMIIHLVLNEILIYLWIMLTSKQQILNSKYYKETNLEIIKDHLQQTFLIFNISKVSDVQNNLWIF